MKDRVALFAALAVFVATGALGIWLDRDRPDDLIANVIFSLFLTAVLVIGALVVWRHPGHKVGWLFVLASVTLALSLTSKTYAHVAYFEGVHLPARSVVAWLSHWLSVPPAGLLLLAMILFPDGHIPSARWRWPVRVLVGAFALAAVGPMFRPGPIDGLRDVQNPYGTSWGDVVWGASQISQSIAVAATIALVVSLVLRSRRGDLVERQQIRWILYGVLLLPIALLLSETVVQHLDRSQDAWWSFLVVMVGLMGVPISIGMAILRYRLYEIDLVINRTLVYASLTALLGLIYFGGVALLQNLLPLKADDDLAVAASTLVVAAIFGPARRRIQAFIDHYFYRRKYDAQKTIDEFSNRLRDEIDLSALNDELMGIVDQTMQPRHVSVWLLPEAET